MKNIQKKDYFIKICKKLQQNVILSQKKSIGTSYRTKKQCNIIFLVKKLALKVIVDCRTISAHKFRIRLGLKQYDIILTKEQSVLTKILNSFEEK